MEIAKQNDERRWQFIGAISYEDVRAQIDEVLGLFYEEDGVINPWLDGLADEQCTALKQRIAKGLAKATKARSKDVFDYIEGYIDEVVLLGLKHDARHWSEYAFSAYVANA